MFASYFLRLSFSTFSGRKLGHGGFGEVVAFTWHDQRAAYKVVPIYGSTELEIEKQKRRNADGAAEEDKTRIRRKLVGYIQCLFRIMMLGCDITNQNVSK